MSVESGKINGSPRIGLGLEKLNRKYLFDYEYFY